MAVKGKGEIPVPNPSRKINPDTGEEIVDKRLQKMLNDHGPSREPWATDNCAEFNAANRLLLKNSNLEDLHVSTYTNKASGKKSKSQLYTFKPPCDNCSELYESHSRIVPFGGTMNDLYNQYFDGN
ncbi:hypothetical protein [Paenibacillus antibioticophila]|uniref:hypothetical protein n=1 Tax=Paenibacillus antibioticophila TaxID=1274374 RepID=UPI0011DCEC09|nr:hypothetical protein [Paenibacillus antibioticophila]